MTRADEYGGRDARWWEEALSSPERVVRLSALRALWKLQRPDPLRSALAGPDRVPAAWALLRLGGEPEDVLLSAMREPPELPEEATREQLVTELVEAASEPRRFQAAARLAAGFEEQAVSPLMDCLRHSRGKHPDAVAEAAAWALGSLGRSILAEACEAYPGATRRARQWIARALWYLGPAAAPAAPLLLSDDRAGWAQEAALLAMESGASLAAARGTSRRVWLDGPAVAELALRAYSSDPWERWRAALTLGSWGPAQDQVLKLLEALCREESPRLREGAVRALGEWPQADPELLLEFNRDPEPEVARAAEESLRPRAHRHMEVWLSVLRRGPGPLRPLAAWWLRKCRQELSDRPDAVAVFLNDVDDFVRWRVAELVREMDLGEWLRQLVDDPFEPVRVCAVRGLRERTLLDQRMRLDRSLTVRVQAVLGLMRLEAYQEASAACWGKDRTLARIALDLFSERGIMPDLFAESHPRRTVTGGAGRSASAMHPSPQDLTTAIEALEEKALRLRRRAPSEETPPDSLAALQTRLERDPLGMVRYLRPEWLEAVAPLYPREEGAEARLAAHLHQWDLDAWRRAAPGLVLLLERDSAPLLAAVARALNAIREGLNPAQRERFESALVRLLEHPEGRIRLSCLEMSWQVLPTSRQDLLPVLERLLADPSPRVRVLALKCHAVRGGDPAARVPTLLDEHPSVRRTALESLAGHPVPVILRDQLSLAARPNPELLEYLWHHLDDQEYLDLILPMVLEAEQPEAWLEAARMCGRSACARAARMLRAPSELERALAERLLESVLPHCGPVLRWPEFLPVDELPSGLRRSLAGRLLEADATPHLGALGSVARSRDPVLATALVTALQRACRQAGWPLPGALELLRVVLRNGAARARPAAARALLLLGEPDSEAVRVTLADPDDRWQPESLLACLGTELLPLLEEALARPDSRAARRAAVTMATMGAPARPYQGSLLAASGRARRRVSREVLGAAAEWLERCPK